MPYKTKKVGNKTCVYKKHGGKKVGCTSGSPKKYLAALHMHSDNKDNLIGRLYDDILKEDKNV